MVISQIMFYFEPGGREEPELPGELGGSCRLTD